MKIAIEEYVTGDGETHVDVHYLVNTTYTDVLVRNMVNASLSTINKNRFLFVGDFNPGSVVVVNGAIMYVDGVYKNGIHGYLTPVEDDYYAEHHQIPTFSNSSYLVHWPAVGTEDSMKTFKILYLDQTSHAL